MNLRTAVTLLPTPTARDWKSGASNLMDVNARPLNEVVVNLFPTPKASGGTHGGPNQRDSSGRYYLPGQVVRVDEQWIGSNGKDYGPAVLLWEEITGHPTPHPTEPGVKGNRRLNPAFSEWMMGLEPGWVTDIVDNRSDALHVIGNGVVPQQAEAAFRFLMDDSNWSTDDMSETKDKPRGECTGCKFEYQLSTARSGEFKGSLVVRKHNSRTGPGLCDGAQKPPAIDTTELGDSVEGPRISADDAVLMNRPLADSAPAAEHTEGCTEEARFGPSVCSGCPEPETPPVSHLAERSRPSELKSDETAVHPGPREGCTETNCGPAGPATATTTDTFADPAPMPAEMPPVSGQPEPDRDRWGRYMINGTAHTRVTTFVKLGSSTFALGEWNERMLIKGLTQRPDLLAMAHGLDVKHDRSTLNSIADQAQETAGNKVAANIGTAYHSFTERLDAGLCSLDDVPEQWRRRCQQYTQKLAEYGLTTRREWIERTTAVRADQVKAPLPVAGTLDRIFELPNGELVIGDLKTSSNIDYAWAEIAAQLAVYAHGVNTHGLFDWNSKSWCPVGDSLGGVTRTVRTDYAIVVHLPADGDGCTLYRVDLSKGWHYAYVSGQVQTRQKDKQVASVLTLAEVPPEPPRNDAWELALSLIADCPTPEVLSTLYEQAVGSGRFDAGQLAGIRKHCAERWAELNIPY